MDFASLLTQPRGLHNFISEIRNTKTKEDERSRVDKELANIRQKFSNSANLSSYDKKKYVWKLCYIYMLGYEVDFGHVEFISLLSSTKFQEKAVGYMAFSMMFRPGDELMTLAVNSMRNDIVGQVHHGQTLALAAVSNMGGNDLAEALSPDVQRLIISPLEQTTLYHNANLSPEQEQRNRSLLCKKAALCLLRLFRTNPDCLMIEDWMRRIAKLLEDRDLGVVTSVLSLLLGLASAHPAAFEPLLPYVVSLLTRLVVSRSVSHDYLYYGIPSPWLQVKCLRFMQYFKIPTDATQLDLLHDALVKVLVRQQQVQMVEQGPAEPSSNKSNAENAILFEAINLIVLYGTECPEQLREQALSLLGRFVSSRDANLRYLAVDAMIRLSKAEGPGGVAVEPFMPAVLDALKDTDISLRKRALTLLFVMASARTAREIVGELVNHLPAAEAAVKEDMIVKVAILAERFADGDLNWYLDTLVQVLLVAGDYAAEAVWFRIAQIIVASPAAHDYAADKLFGLVQAKGIPELLVSLGAYVLGELGVNICEQPGKSGYDQFVALHQHFGRVGPKTQGLLLTAYAKLANLYPEQVRDLAGDLFSKYSASAILDLQQRAVEYRALIGDAVRPEVLEAVLNTMPALAVDARENVLLAIEQQQQAGESAATAKVNVEGAGRTADRPAWAVDKEERDASRAAADEVREAQYRERDRDRDRDRNRDLPPAKPQQQQQQQPVAPPVPPAKVMDLLSMDDDAAPSSSSYSSSNGGADETAAVERNALAAQLVRGAANRSRLLSLSGLLSVTVAGEVRGAQGRYALFFSAASGVTLANIKVAVERCPVGLTITLQTAELPGIAGGEEGRIMIAAEASRPFPFTDGPRLSLSFTVPSSGAKREGILLPLPISLLSFCTPLPMDRATYMTRWKAIAAPGTEAQQVFPAGKAVDEAKMGWVRETLLACLGPAEGLDTDARTLTGGLTFSTTTQGPDGRPVVVGALLRLEADYGQNRYRVTVRSTNGTVATAVKDYVLAYLG